MIDLTLYSSLTDAECRVNLLTNSQTNQLTNKLKIV